MERYTWDRPRIGSDLDAIKFICKEFWVELFRKQARRCCSPPKRTMLKLTWQCLSACVDRYDRAGASVTGQAATALSS